MMQSKSTFANPKLNFFQNYRNHLNAVVFTFKDESYSVRKLISLLFNLDKSVSLNDLHGVNSYLDNKIEKFSIFCIAYQLVLIEKFLLEEIEKNNPDMLKYIQSSVDKIDKINLYIEYLNLKTGYNKADYEDKIRVLEGVKSGLESHEASLNFIQTYNYILEKTKGLDLIDGLNSKTFFSLYLHNEQEVVNESKNMFQKFLMNHSKLKKFYFALGLNSLFEDAEQGFISLYKPLVQYSLLKEIMIETFNIFVNHTKTIIEPLYDSHDFLDEISKPVGSACLTILALCETWALITNCFKWMAVKIGIMSGNIDEITNNIESSFCLAVGFSICSASLLLHSILSIIIRPIVTLIQGWNMEDKLRFIDNSGPNEGVFNFISKGIFSKTGTDISPSDNIEEEDSLNSDSLEKDSNTL